MRKIGNLFEQDVVKQSDLENFKKAKTIIRALDHPVRMQILTFLLQSEAEEESKTVTDLYTKFRTEQSVMSQHLAILRRANLVFPDREGKNIYYHPNPGAVIVINDAAAKMCECLKAAKERKSATAA